AINSSVPANHLRPRPKPPPSISPSRRPVVPRTPPPNRRAQRNPRVDLPLGLRNEKPSGIPLHHRGTARASQTGPAHLRMRKASPRTADRRLTPEATGSLVDDGGPDLARPPICPPNPDQESRARQPNALSTNVAACSRVTGSSGQNSSLSGGLHPVVIPASARLLMS